MYQAPLSKRLYVKVFHFVALFRPGKGQASQKLYTVVLPSLLSSATMHSWSVTDTNSAKSPQDYAVRFWLYHCPIT